jgi:hypothetical protein
VNPERVSNRVGSSCGAISPQASPNVHPPRVKLQNRENSLYIKENNNSLSIFLPFTPTPSRDARPRVFACVRERGGERVNLQIRYFPASGSEDGRGNSRQYRQSLFALSGFFTSTPTHMEVSL